MQWILMVVGGLLGALGAAPFSGAVLGFAIGQAMALRKLMLQNVALQKKIHEFDARIEARTRDLHERLMRLEVGERQQGSATQATSQSQELAPDPIQTPVVNEPLHATPATATPTVPLVAEPAPIVEAAAAIATHHEKTDVAPVAATPVEAGQLPEPAGEVLSPQKNEVLLPDFNEPIPTPAAKARTAPRPQTPLKPLEPSPIERAFAAARNWLFGGNTVLRIGVVLLFIGLAFLLRYASERVSLPVEFRYAGVALAAIVLLVIGWRLREKRTAYGLMLQGTGIAVLYLTIFAALRLHPLIPAGAALALLIVVTVCLAVLAVLQNAMSLAVVAVLGGFAAPILTSTGSGNHVALFSYFALLNAGIFIIAWYRAWRLLNLVGFLGTFGIGFAWGMKSYKPELFATTEPFLLLFILMYVGIGLMFARRKLIDAAPPPQERQAMLRWSVKQADYIDATVMFGPPIVGFGLQCALIRHIEFGMAFSALVFGLFYMMLARIVQSRATADRTSLLMEVYLALGVIFGTLAIPLGLDARWTSAAWAVEGAGIYWLGIRQQRRVARIFALLLQIGAALTFISGLQPGVETVISGTPLGALMLGAAFLFSYLQLRRAPAQALATYEPLWMPLLACAGLAFLYLIAPLALGINYTAIAWALAGLATLYAGLRLYSSTFLLCAFAVQILGAALFFLNMDVNDGQGSALASGWQGLMTASLIGAMLIAGMVLAARDPLVKDKPQLLFGLNLVLLIGLVFINLAVLFVLPWRTASAVWAGSGLLIIWLSLMLRQRLSFYFGIALQLVGGLAFLSAFGPGVFDSLSAEGLRPLAHSAFWTPALLSLAAMIGAWRLRRANAQEQTLGFPGLSLGLLSTALLVWGALWWVFAGVTEINRFIPQHLREHVALIFAAVSVMLWMLLALRERWREMAALCLVLMPSAAVALMSAWNFEYQPLANLGWIAWPLVLAAHFITLRLLASLLPASLLRAAHVLGCWMILGVLALEMRFLFALLADQYNAWRWLGWALVPSAYLLLVSSSFRMPWPIREFMREYRVIAATPVALIMLVWFWIANLMSNGSAQPLPYLPIVNPLEIGLLIVLFALYRWSANCLEPLIADKHAQSLVRQGMAGVSLFALLTMAVCRAAHHLFGVPFDVDALGNSMLVQAGLSLVWTLCALALTIAGTRMVRRDLWMVGAVLVGVVVVKMFFIELGNSGSLERIISFIGVGVLLLVVGYFSPLPPRRAEAAKEASPT